ncbi:MAG TPA: hypothetical protein EYM34_05805, partial [Alphaproteobacteria bacterium]|nr:hypothetical protein [Alphaproteobacteria bacterium]
MVKALGGGTSASRHLKAWGIHMILSGFSHRGARWLASVAVAVLIIIPNGQTAWAQDDNPVAATVNGETITRTEILL